MESQVYSPQTKVAVTPVALPNTNMLYLTLKRLIDIAGSLFGLVLLFPLFSVLAILVRLSSAGPILHRRRVLSHQQYEGGTPQSFDAFKFRTMITNADAFLAQHPELMAEFQKDFKLRDDPRVTKVGHKLRRSSLDELPQLFNVLRGQMTLVGPRMISPPELEMYGEYAAKLLSVKPGLTGLWQVSGRQNVSYAERVKLDMYYIDNRTLGMDIEILLRTVVSVLKRQGAY
ncbi:sugar transferase [Armatimonas rosea]|uniref:Lipopolysaccharide/colanic/teichoic acid biosynthesis glycosyltransferase n=1 Tax=Armatimonas rosea TaxID=685828 RepID=A0A7W9SV44_ARMRO|nr:sugar transferase [Armatimonas rosea]MBB6052779.1 lipopolysaccharide/colanic/teichoic acid biosynthesis glycosyltransferase [Armatimonas rosea]